MISIRLLEYIDSYFAALLIYVKILYLRVSLSQGMLIAIGYKCAPARAALIIRMSSLYPRKGRSEGTTCGYYVSLAL